MSALISSFSEDAEYVLNLPSHLVDGGMAGELCQILIDFEFVEYKIAASGTQSLIEDFGLALERDIPFEKSVQESLRLIQSALQLATNPVAEDSTQLTGQLLGRLMPFETSEIQVLLTQVKQWQGASWLRPLVASLTIPGNGLRRTLRAHTGGVNAVAVTPNSQKIVSGGEDKMVKVWELSSGRELLTLQSHTGSINAIALTPDGQAAISASDDHTLSSWDLNQGAEIQTFWGHEDRVWAVAITPDGQQMFSGSSDGTIKLWELATGQELHSFREENSRKVRAIALTPDGKKLISVSTPISSTQGALKVWDVENRVEQYTLAEDVGWASSIAITPNGRSVICSLISPFKLLLWDLVTQTQLPSISGDLYGSVRAITISSDGKIIVSGDAESTIKLWEFNTHKLLHIFEGHTESVKAVTITQNGQHLVSASSDGTLKIWDFNLNQQIQQTNLPGTIVDLAIASHGKLAITTDNRKLLLWNMQTYQVVKSLEDAHLDRIRAIAISSDRRWVTTGAEDCTLKVWDVLTGAVIKTVGEFHTSPVTAVTISADGKTIISGHDDGSIRFWDADTSELLQRLEAHQGTVMALRMVASNSVLSASTDSTLKLWDVASGICQLPFEGHTDAVLTIEVTADGKRAISASADHTLKLWDLESGIHLRNFVGHTDGILSIKLAPDQQSLISASADGTYRSWNVETGQELDQQVGDPSGYQRKAERTVPARDVLINT